MVLWQIEKTLLNSLGMKYFGVQINMDDTDHQVLTCISCNQVLACISCISSIFFVTLHYIIYYL